MFKAAILLIVILVYVKVPATNAGFEIFSAGDDVVKADSLYQASDYASALFFYKQAIARSEFNNTAELQFKIAYALYKTGDFDKSGKIFRSLYEKMAVIPDFSRFFYIKSLWETDAESAARESITYIADFKKNSLADSLLIPLADYLFNQEDYQQSRKYYLMAKRRNVDKSKRAYLRIQAAKSICKSGNKAKAFEEYYQIIKKFSSYPETFDLCLLIKEKYPSFFNDHFFNIVDVYLANRKYSALQNLLEEFIKKENDPLKIEKARYYLIRIYYSRGKYRTALYGFNNLLKNLQNKKLEPHIRLYIARILIRIDKRQQSIDAYLDYAHRYPTRRIAPQAVWKCAWIYEEMNDLPSAMKLYKQLLKRWPRNSLAKEAVFRIGFDYFRLGQYEKADSVFDVIKRKRWKDLHITRAKYWQSVCKEKLNDYTAAVTIRSELSDDPWMNYYTMKSYLKDRDMEDIVTNFSAQTDDNFPLENNDALLINLVNNFEKFFLVEDLLGLNYANCVLENMKLRARTLTEWINLAEMYKKIGAYNKAFRVYDYINKKYYADVKYSDKFFILKERFPYYYDNIIEKYAERNNVSKELILSVIKQESVFDTRAHSFANAYGLMQLIPSTARELAALLSEDYKNPQQLFDADFNVKLGSYYLKRLLKRYDNRYELVFSAYNAGPHRVKKWLKLQGSENQDMYIENIEFNETRNYVRLVLKNFWAYQLLNLSFRS